MYRRTNSVQRFLEIEGRIDNLQSHVKDLKADMKDLRDDMKKQHQEFLFRIDAIQEKSDVRYAANMEKMEARIAADRKEAAERLAVDRKEAEARQRAVEERLVQERKESEKRIRTHTGLLVAIFLTALFGMIGVYASLLVSNGYLPAVAEFLSRIRILKIFQ